jgi:tellurite resistance protein TerC
MTSAATPILWIIFAVVVIVALTLDLGVFNRRAHEVRSREALVLSAFWIALALCFNLWVYRALGSQAGLEFLTGYLIEKALSVDNLFVILVIFNYFAVPKELQHRVLFWGVVGALVARGVFILVGAALLQAFHWLIYLFGAFLVFTGIRLLSHQQQPEPEKNPILRFLRRFIRSVSDYRGTHFTVVESKRRYATPLLLVLLTIEATDIVFAVDSIPAVFAVTRDPFIVFTSNIFAVLGLRALYFVLAGVLLQFRYLRVGLALVLSYVGIKMLISGFYVIPIGVSLAIVATLLGGSVLASLGRPKVRDPGSDGPRPELPGDASSSRSSP